MISDETYTRLDASGCREVTVEPSKRHELMVSQASQLPSLLSGCTTVRDLLLPPFFPWKVSCHPICSYSLESREGHYKELLACFVL